MVPKGNCAIRHYAHTLPVTNVSTELLGNCGIVFHRTDMLGKRCPRYTITPFLHRQNN